MTKTSYCYFPNVSLSSSVIALGVRVLALQPLALAISLLLWDATASPAHAQPPQQGRYPVALVSS